MTFTRSIVIFNEKYLSKIVLNLSFIISFIAEGT
jgi:hypothetical protein